MEKDIINRIIEKEFVELTEAERIELFEYCASEEEYMQLKNMFTRIENMDFENPTPRDETKRDLDLLFDQSHPKATQIWYSSLLSIVIPREKPFYRQPLLHIAAVVLLIFLAVPLFNSKIADTQFQLAKVEQTIKEEAIPVEEELKNDKNESVVAKEVKPEDIPEIAQPIMGMETTISARGGMPVAAGKLDSEITNDRTTTISDHPDGVFMGGASDGKIAFSQPASETADLMDLLTAVF